MLIAETTFEQPQPQQVEESESPEQQQNRAAVKQWLSRISHAKSRFESDFKRMREDMEFATGIQWLGQTDLNQDQYTNNITLKLTNQKVATLYAKNPKATVTRRKRLDFQIWDGKQESLVQNITQAAMLLASGQPLPPELAAFMADVEQGQQRIAIVSKLCETLEILYQYQVDISRPEFKEQFKQLVRRTIITGVGYVRPHLCRDGERYLSTVDHGSEQTDRLERIRQLVQKIESNEGSEQNDAHYATLRSLVLSVGAGQALNSYDEINERIEFDFLPSTSVIVDPRCRSLKEFIAARWIAIEYCLPVEEVNAVFGVDVKVGSGEGNAKEVTRTNYFPSEEPPKATDPLNSHLVSVYEVFDYNTKTSFFLCDGWKDYLREAEFVTPEVKGFWHIFALTFNDCESDPSTKASIYPPSDVRLMKHIQKEWNRTREALRDHRLANAPKYIVRKGYLTDEDKRKLSTSTPHSVIEIEGIPAEAQPANFISVMQMAQVDPSLYDTTMLENDMMLGIGMQSASIGAAQPNVTATVGSIAEQSRMNVSASNIDDLDGLLSRLAQACTEMMLQEFSLDTVKQIAGPGAVWPLDFALRKSFLNEVSAKVEAASSGRPNKAVDIANWRDLAPMLVQAGANPVGVISQTAKRLDDNIDVAEFFPVIPQAPTGSQSMEQGGPAAPNGPQSSSSPEGPSPANPPNRQPRPAS